MGTREQSSKKKGHHFDAPSEFPALMKNMAEIHFTATDSIITSSMGQS